MGNPAGDGEGRGILREMVKDREAWRAAILKSEPRLPGRSSG